MSDDLPQRQQVEKALRRSERMLRLVIDHLPQAVFWKDRDSVFLGCNQALADAVGLERPGDIVGKTDHDLSVTEEEADFYRECDRRVVDSGAPETHIHEHLRKPDGSVMWIDTSKIPLRDDAGKVIGILGTFEDITERIRLERLIEHRVTALTQPGVELEDISLTDLVDLSILQELQDGFARAFDMPSLIYGPDGTPITKPSRFTKFCALIRSATKGSASCETFDAEMIRALGETRGPQTRRGCVLANMVTGTVPIIVRGLHLANWGINQMVSGELDFDEIRRYAREIGLDEGEVIEAAKTLVPVQEEDFERAVAFLGVLAQKIGLLGLQNLQQAREIAERKRIEAERARLISAIEQSAETIVITDAEGTIQYANPSFERITGYTVKEAVGQNLRILRSGEHEPAFYRKMWDTVKQGGTWEGRIVNRKKDGTLYTEEVSISPVRDASGTTVNFVTVRRDVTHELKLEEQLRQSQKMEAIGQLAGGVAHDFNNLLCAILGYTSMVVSHLTPGEPDHARLEQVYKAAQRASDLTQQLLAFSRRQVIQPVDLDLNKVIDGVLTMVRRLIGENIELDFIPGHGLGTVRADRGQIGQVLLNLCVNSRDAMPEGGKLTIETENVLVDGVYVETHPEARPGRYVLLSITDTGCGMDAPTLEQIFEPYFTTKEAGKGTGLGLATVYGIVKQHDGQVSVYSESGKGTMFKIYLPEVARRATDVSSSIPGPTRGGMETILLAEDDDLVLGFATEILREAGYAVMTARDGREALCVFEEHADEIDLLLLDVVMPRLGGEEVLGRILEMRPGLRHLFTSGYSENAVHTNFVQKRGLHLLRKPYRADMLLRTVREILDT